tara:strand:+ start:820 stop:1536 length:717 start_codon:yes stop_codon:yes gene_type:complete
MKYNLFTLKTRNRIKKLLGKTKTKKRELQIDHSDTLLTQIKKIDKKVLDGVVLEYKFNPCRKWRFDLCFPQIMLAVEADGGQYSNGTGGAHNSPKDYEKINQAQLQGWLVLRYQTKTILHNPDSIVNEIKIAKEKLSVNSKGFYANNKKTQRLSQDLEQPLLELAECYWEGFQKYPKNDWEKRSVEHHIEHIEAHIQGYKKDINNTDERYNLIHAACRLMMINAKFHYRDKNLFFRSL